MKQFNVWILAGVMALGLIGISEACSCMPMHPQKHYCQSDFVILARIKKEFTHNDTRTYKVRIRKEYKMSEKAVVALKSGRLQTAISESMCGIRLETGKLYAIAGKVESLRARINLCGFNEQWNKLSKRQRRGLNRMYQQGCNCGIKNCYHPRQCPTAKDFCIWSTWSIHDHLDCQRTQGICLRSMSNQCVWARNKVQKACMKNRTSTLNTTTKKPPLTISLWSG